jgi:hypothetical protein
MNLMDILPPLYEPESATINRICVSHYQEDEKTTRQQSRYQDVQFDEATHTFQINHNEMAILYRHDRTGFCLDSGAAINAVQRLQFLRDPQTKERQIRTVKGKIENVSWEGSLDSIAT